MLPGSEKAATATVRSNPLVAVAAAVALGAVVARVTRSGR